MNKKNMFTDFKAEILDKKPANFEMAGYTDADLMFIKAVAIEEGVNANDALFQRNDLNKAKHSFIGKPLKIRFISNDPTGHGYDRATGKFDEIVKAIGYIYDVEAQIVKEDSSVETIWGDDIPEGGHYQILVHMVVWQKYYPEIAYRLRQLHAEGNLKFSIEAEREFDVSPEGYRRCFNILFNGLAVVKNPAFENARSLMVAELLKDEGGKQMDFEKLYNEKVQELSDVKAELATANETIKVASNELQTAKNEMASINEQLVELQGTVKTISAERDTFKATVEATEKVKLGTERFDKLSKYGEVAKSADELAELSKEDFVNLMAEMVEKYVPTNKQENAENENNNGVMGVPHEKGTKSQKGNRKEKLLNFIEGLAK